jgi:serine/threonine protein kinase
LLEEIARGGMGVVYRARQSSLNRDVAVKMILAGELARTEDVQRFRAEAEAAAKLQHPNIVAIHEVGQHEGHHYFSMDLVDGPNLAQLLREGPLPAKRAAGYVKIIAEAIHFAHTRGILHRDHKPSNVLIDANDQPRITDFGLAKNLANDSSLSVTGQVHGSPSFMPPEQAAGQRKKVGVTSDVYSLGAILYHALTGRPPFAGQTIAEMLKQVENNEPVAPRLLNPSIPRDLETVCLKCLAKEQNQRYTSASELVEELERFLEDKPVHARPVTGLERVWRRCRRRPVVTGLSLALAGIVVAAVCALASQRSSIEHLTAITSSLLRIVSLRADSRSGETSSQLSVDRSVAGGNGVTKSRQPSSNTIERATSSDRGQTRVIAGNTNPVITPNARLSPDPDSAVSVHLPREFSSSSSEPSPKHDPPLMVMLPRFEQNYTTLELKVLRPANDDQDQAGHVKLDAAASRKLRQVFKWKHYFVINTLHTVVPWHGTNSVQIDEASSIVFTHLNGLRFGVQTIANGKSISKTTRDFAAGDFVVSTDVGDDGTGRLILINRVVRDGRR